MDAVDEFHLHVEQNGHGPVVWVSGELDIATAPALRECLESLDGQVVTLDLADVTFLDSGALAVLVDAWKERQDTGGEVILRAVQPAQMRVFEVTGLDDVLNFDGD